ncbi:Protein EXORDIUM-like 5 [Orobanche hederae]
MFVHYYYYVLLLLFFDSLFPVQFFNSNNKVNAAAAIAKQELDQIFNPQLQLPPRSLSASKRFEGSSNLVNLRYHMGPVLSSPINIYLIWYDTWLPSHQLLIKDFLLSISTSNHPSPSPSVSEWWRTVSLYTDQTGANITRSVLVAGEYSDTHYSHGKNLTRLSIQQVIATAVRSKPFHVDHKNGIYLVLTATDVTVQEFCRAVCGFHYFTFPSMVGYTLPYAWVGDSGSSAPRCAPIHLPCLDTWLEAGRRR